MAEPSTMSSQRFDLGQTINTLAGAGASVGTAYINAQAAKSAAKSASRLAPGGNTMLIFAGIAVVGFLGYVMLKRK